MTTFVQRVNIFKVLLNLLSKFSFIFLFISLSGMRHISLLHTENFPKRILCDQTKLMDVLIRKTFLGHSLGKIKFTSSICRGCCKDFPKKEYILQPFQDGQHSTNHSNFYKTSKYNTNIYATKIIYAHPKTMHLFICSYVIWLQRKHIISHLNLRLSQLAFQDPKCRMESIFKTFGISLAYGYINLSALSPQKFQLLK